MDILKSKYTRQGLGFLALLILASLMSACSSTDKHGVSVSRFSFSEVAGGDDDD
ncbi:hypothetical protein [Rubellicoccus peritrichatus]|uniref:Lipoprotein n=1 Tax=Rubellicoccus peritrichatus TaxID=3080537 RepID=A0AAQ3LBR3_9BACT|nr:hypothetical protein [Puniceicoccus sp. CR14]WOO42387.1 hypothetical protein RZN69_04745 [Puniceicoccus sp. CR14]